MLKGDLTTTSLPAVLRSLADGAGTGCLRVDDGIREDARVYLRNGKVYAVVLPGRSPRLGARLVASGQLSPGDLAEATEAQRTELQGWRLGELLVHLGYVEQPVVEAFVSEQLGESAAELMLLSTGRWTFRASERTREDVAPPVPVDDLLAEVDRRRAQFDALAPLVHGPDSVPVLSSADTAPESQSLDPEAWSLLCAVDGERSLAGLAAASGSTLYEAGALLASLVEAGLVEVEPPVPTEADVWAVDVELLDQVDAPDAEVTPPAGPAAIAARLAEALEGLAPDPVAMAPTLMAGEDQHRVLEAQPDEVEVGASLERASESLAVALGDPTGELDLFPVDGVPRKAPVLPLDTREAERRARDAAELVELVEQQAELESARAAEAAREQQELSAALQAEAFAELTASFTESGSAPESSPDEAQRVDAAPDVDDFGIDDEPTPPLGADTAALMRELSSLGLDDEPAPMPQPRTHTPAPAPAAKKRKGLFGR